MLNDTASEGMGPLGHRNHPNLPNTTHVVLAQNGTDNVATS